MFQKFTFKVLGNLILLVTFCISQVAAAPSNNANAVRKTPSLSGSLALEKDTLHLVPKFTQPALMAVGETIRVSVDSSGMEGNSGTFDPTFSNSISADGRYVAFHSYASNLVSGDTNFECSWLHPRSSALASPIVAYRSPSRFPAVSLSDAFLSIRSSPATSLLAFLFSFLPPFSSFLLSYSFFRNFQPHPMGDGSGHGFSKVRIFMFSLRIGAENPPFVPHLFR